MGVVVVLGACLIVLVRGLHDSAVKCMDAAMLHASQIADLRRAEIKARKATLDREINPPKARMGEWKVTPPPDASHVIADSRI